MEESGGGGGEGCHLARDLVDPLLSMSDEAPFPLEGDGIVAACFASCIFQLLDIVALRCGSYIADSSSVGLPEREEPSQGEHARLVREREGWGE